MSARGYRYNHVIPWLKTAGKSINTCTFGLMMLLHEAINLRYGLMEIASWMGLTFYGF